MLTRIEIDGFKTFRDFAMDIPPFMVVLGRNASGKSNLFDAIRFLTLIASGTLVEAVHQMRGDIDELLHVPLDGSSTKLITFAVEVLLDPTVRDDFGEERQITHSRLRYEVQLEARPGASSRNARSDLGRQRLYVKYESATLIRMNEDSWVKGLGLRGTERTNLAPYSNKSRNILLETTRTEHGKPAFKVHQDGRAGNTKSLPAADAAATVLSTLATMEYLHLFALKREMQKWRQLHLEPEAVRSPSSFDDDDHMLANGGNLANVLNRIVERTASTDRPAGILPSISSSLSRIIPEVSGVQVVDDDSRRQRHVVVQTGDSGSFSAIVASDGTVRTLALLAALYDPDEGGLICFEEPENGIYPQRLVDLVKQLQDLVWGSLSRRLVSRSEVVNQLIISSHSPVMIRAISRGQSRAALGQEIVFFDMVSRGGPEGKSRVSRSRTVISGDQGELDVDQGRPVSQAEVATFEVWSHLG